MWCGRSWRMTLRRKRKPSTVTYVTPGGRVVYIRKVGK